MRVILVALLASYLRMVVCGTCAECTAWTDYPTCAYNERCYVAFRSSCEMEMVNCKLPDSYKFVKAAYYGHCFRPNIAQCKSYVLKELLSNRSRAVEIFA